MTFKQLTKIRLKFVPVSTDEEAFSHLNGWLDRDSKFYPCSVYGHADLADEIVRRAGIKIGSLFLDGERELEKRGWVKISNGHVLFFRHKVLEMSGASEHRKPSKEQNDFVMLYLSFHQKPDRLQSWMDDREHD